MPSDIRIAILVLIIFMSEVMIYSDHEFNNAVIFIEVQELPHHTITPTTLTTHGLCCHQMWVTCAATKRSLLVIKFQQTKSHRIHHF